MVEYAGCVSRVSSLLYTALLAPLHRAHPPPAATPRPAERGESFYNPQLQSVVDDLMARGVAEESEGAKCVFVEGAQVPLIVQKSDGGFGYASTDMAAGAVVRGRWCGA